MTNIDTINNIRVVLSGEKDAFGGQARVKFGRLEKNPAVDVIVKYIDYSREALIRLKAQFDLNLPKRNPYLFGALAYEPAGNKIKILCLRAQGIEVSQDKQPRSLIKRLACGHMLAAQLHFYESMGLGYGDWHWDNVLFDELGNIGIIDQDNIAFRDPDIPPPPMKGHPFFRAPELDKKGARSTIKSDRFSFGGVMATVLLGRNPISGFGRTEDEIRKVLSYGTCPENLRGEKPKGIPFEALGSQLTALIDQSYSLHPNDRPSANDWLHAFSDVWHNVYQHNCGEVLVTCSDCKCPWCGKWVELPTTSHGSVIMRHIKSGTVYDVLNLSEKQAIIGRGNLPITCLKVSKRHLRLSSDSTYLYLENIGRNETKINYRNRTTEFLDFKVALQELEKKPLRVWMWKEPIEFDFVFGN